MERKVLDSCGISGTGETPQARLKRAEEAHRPPRGKRASWSGNQSTLKETWSKKTAKKQTLKSLLFHPMVLFQFLDRPSHSFDRFVQPSDQLNSNDFATLF
ncbi:hypothetical protein FBF83_04300 [Pseudalkalibacillus hwajinpoensis]|uniref:Uncharacterized protein n=1 Tax=Guptibacillus hwajinpoensis TaxID=208199 RepID=A0A4V6WS16_9BACL|nr:hypothetical protein FBF83_04300 [Pseudalkalibacillus hwajinpoensis]